MFFKKEIFLFSSDVKCRKWHRHLEWTRVSKGTSKTPRLQCPRGHHFDRLLRHLHAYTHARILPSFPTLVRWRKLYPTMISRSYQWRGIRCHYFICKTFVSETGADFIESTCYFSQLDLTARFIFAHTLQITWLLKNFCYLFLRDRL